jgi:hypothetical protein
MKFAQSLRKVTGIYSQYVCYKTLKKLINAIERQERDPEQKPVAKVTARELWWFDFTIKTSVSQVLDEEIAFVRTLEMEINRIARLYSSKTGELRDMLTEVFRRIFGRFSLENIVKDIDLIAKGESCFNYERT